MKSKFSFAPLGCGVGLRSDYFDEIISSRPKCNWFEIITDNFLGIGGYSRECLEEISKHYTVIPHSVATSVGSTDPLDFKYLASTKEILNLLNAPWTSDHLCFTMIDHANLSDLIPLPFTEESVSNCVKRIKAIQDFCERPFLIENVTRYITPSSREMLEDEFLNRILEGANCGLLLDLTNVYLNSKYHDFDPYQFITSLSLDRVVQIHLAGWQGRIEDGAIDTHDAPVPPEVLDLLKFTVKLIGKSSPLIEWDEDLPSLQYLLSEANQVDKIISDVLS